MIAVAQWTSSSTSSSGPSAASAVNSAATAARTRSPAAAEPGVSRGPTTGSTSSPSRVRRRSPIAGGTVPAYAGCSSRATVRARRSRAVSGSSVSSMPQAVRTMSATADRSRPSPYGVQRPHSTRAPGSSPWKRESSCARRVLPTPASPETSTLRGDAVSETSSRRPTSRPSSASRPIIGTSSPRPSRLADDERRPTSSYAVTGSRLPLSRSGVSARQDAAYIVASAVSRPA